MKHPVPECHTLICGVTMCGKTTLARQLSREIERAEKSTPIVVYDPVHTTETAGGDWADSAIIFTREDLFLNYVEKLNQRAFLFVDESADLFSHEKRYNQWILTMGRHHGFIVVIISQRPKMIAPTCRNQCGLLYMFRMAPNDSAEVLADFGHGRNDADLDRGDYLRIESGTARVERGNIFNDLKRKR